MPNMYVHFQLSVFYFNKIKRSPIFFMFLHFFSVFVVIEKKKEEEKKYALIFKIKYIIFSYVKMDKMKIIEKKRKKNTHCDCFYYIKLKKTKN